MSARLVPISKSISTHAPRTNRPAGRTRPSARDLLDKGLDTMVRRIIRTLDRHMRAFEAELRRENRIDDAAWERTARTLASITRSVEKLHALVRERAASAPAPERTTDAELRAALDSRLDRLAAEAAPPAVPGKSDHG